LVQEVHKRPNYNTTDGTIKQQATNKALLKAKHYLKHPKQSTRKPSQHNRKTSKQNNTSPIAMASTCPQTQTEKTQSFCDLQKTACSSREAKNRKSS
jgi:hypothetical protein